MRHALSYISSFCSVHFLACHQFTWKMMCGNKWFANNVLEIIIDGINGSLYGVISAKCNLSNADLRHIRTRRWPAQEKVEFFVSYAKFCHVSSVLIWKQFCCQYTNSVLFLTAKETMWEMLWMRARFTWKMGHMSVERPYINVSCFMCIKTATNDEREMPLPMTNKNINSLFSATEKHTRMLCKEYDVTLPSPPFEAVQVTHIHVLDWNEGLWFPLYFPYTYPVTLAIQLCFYRCFDFIHFVPRDRACIVSVTHSFKYRKERGREGKIGRQRGSIEGKGLS